MTPTALIVDDELSIQGLLEIFLGREGFVVDCASNIRDAERFLGETKYDLIIADIYLGKGTGIDLLRQIRSYDKNAQVVLITGHPDVESAAEALRLGACDYLSKPLTPQQIIGTVQRALRTKKLIEESERKQANLDAIFRSASDGIILVDRDNRLAQVNEAAMRSCGYAQDHLGVSLAAIGAGCAGTCRKALADVLRDGVRRTVRRFECHKKDGAKRIVSLSASPVTEGDGAVSGAVAIIRDETVLASLEQQLHRQSGYGGIIGRNAAMQRMPGPTAITRGCRTGRKRRTWP